MVGHWYMVECNGSIEGNIEHLQLYQPLPFGDVLDQLIQQMEERANRLEH